MTTLQALFLGLVQGLTEFLPVSSSAHLAFAQNFFSLKETLFFDVMLHLGTLFAIFVYFRKDLASLILALAGRPSDAPLEGANAWRGDTRQAWRYAVWIIIGTVPAGIAGLLFEDTIEKAFHGMLVPALCLLVTGAILFLAARVKPGTRDAHESAWQVALYIGLAQAVALMPGISRSGATICAALFLGLSRNAAARFSFFLAIPAILGAAVLSGKDLIGAGAGIPYPGPTLAGAAMAFLSGLVALYLLIGVLRRGNLGLFAYYCWAVGGIMAVLSFFR